jgi:hypothetical protein
MALLNWGNALSQAGKAMATVGLEGVKATMEQDKIRLAADLAEQSTIRAEDRKWTNEQAQQPIKAKWALDAVKSSEQAKIDLATDPTNVGKITEAKRLEAVALDKIQTDIDTQHANDPLWKAAQKVKYDALNPYAASDAAYKNIATRAETLKLNTAISIKDLTSKIAAETDPVKKQALVDEREAKSWSIEGDRAERLASRAERASVGTYIASQQTELARLKAAGAVEGDPDVEGIRSSLPGFQALYKRLSAEAYPDLKVPEPRTGTPAPGAGAGAGTGTAKPAALPNSGTRPVTETPGVFSRIGTSVTKALAAQGQMEMNTANAASRSTYAAFADEINAAFKNKTKVVLPAGGVNILKSVMAFDPELLDPSARDYAAGLSKPGITGAKAADFLRKP